jgi:HEAT repeat protein
MCCEICCVLRKPISLNPSTRIQTMTANHLKTTALVNGTAAAIAGASRMAEAASVDDLITRIKSQDDNVRGPAWQGAGPCGAPAVKPLATAMTDPDFEIARAAKRALWKIVRHAGRPGAAKEAHAVATELITLLANGPAVVRREALWMLSELGGDDAVPPMAALLSDQAVREDARCALMRLPGRKSTAALKSAFAGAPEEFKFALAESLRQRGEKLSGYPSRKLVPTRPTTVAQPKAN